jgi:hypothetical protein
MDYHELHKLTVAKLREMAKEYPDVVGASGMHKDQLVELLCGRLGIPMPHKVAVGEEKVTIKTRIRELKKERDAAIAAKDGKKLRELRHKLHRSRRALRKAAKGVA